MKRNLYNHNRIKQKQKHKNSGKAKGFKDPEYLNYLHKELKPSCYHCGRAYVDEDQLPLNFTAMHHIKDHSIVGRDDSIVIPLCNSTCHLNGEVSPHGGTEAWFMQHPKEEQIEYARGMYHDYLFTKGKI